jgi:uncharacterized membrane protein
MIATFRTLRLLAIVVWVGGLIFFAFVVAPVAFRVLPSGHEAGSVVAGTLGVLNRMGFLCGPVFLMATGLLALLWPRRYFSSAIAQILLVVAMMAATNFVQWKIVPAMERDRVAAGGDVDAAAANNPARLDFERLHPLSEKVEGSALFMGLAVVVLMGFERDTERTDWP